MTILEHLAYMNHVNEVNDMIMMTSIAFMSVIVIHFYPVNEHHQQCHMQYVECLHQEVGKENSDE